MIVSTGLVTGTSATTTPTGDASSTIPSSRRLITPLAGLPSRYW
jgi:hypothetical protein